MGLRMLQILLALGNCVYGILLLSQFGYAALGWPLALHQIVVLLIGVSVLPLALIGLRFPVAAGLLEFACAFIGKQLGHDGGQSQLLHDSTVSMGISMAILAIAVLRGVVQTTREAFEAPELPRAGRKARESSHPRRAA